MPLNTLTGHRSEPQRLPRVYTHPVTGGRHRFQAPFRWVLDCAFWTLGLRQYSFHHAALVPWRVTPCAWA